MTYIDAVAESKYGVVHRYRDNQLVIANHPRNIAFVYLRSEDALILTIIDEGERALCDWQPVRDASTPVGRDPLCAVCGAREAVARCMCGQPCCAACIGSPHWDGPHLCGLLDADGPQRVQ